MFSKIKADKILLITLFLFVAFGFFIFLSASFGVLVRGNSSYASVVLNQLVLGILGGTAAAIFMYFIPFNKLKKYSIWIYLSAIILTLLVFIDGIGVELGGSKRWIYIGSFSFQPSELLKIGYIIFLANWLSSIKEKIQTYKYGVIPFLIFSAIPALILFFQPDNDTMIIILFTGFCMFFLAGAKLKHIFLISILSALLLFFGLSSRGYVVERVSNFFNPGSNSLTSGWQVEQSLIAIGSGNFWGRGYGQSLQKFEFLPESIGDSIFSVFAEEFGFFGSSILVAFFLFLLIRCFQLALKTKNKFGGLIVFGIAIMIVTQSFFNMAAMLKIIPLSGLPLIFVSKGGTSLFFTLLSMGIILNISSYKNKII